MVLRAVKLRRIHEEIVAQIREQLAEGQLKPGNQLPSERDLAEQFQVSRASVREAMRAALPVLAPTAAIDQVTSCITRDCPAVFIDLGEHQYEILTKYDLLHAIARLVRQPQ